MARKFSIAHPPPFESGELAAMGREIREKYGPRIGWEELARVLEDRSCVRYPCEIRFDAGPLLPGEFAHTEPRGAQPEAGYIIYVHPVYASQLSLVPYLVLHQIVSINFGPSASADDAEIFGCQALGLSQEEYYRALCDLAHQTGGDDLC